MNAVHASNTPHIRQPGECGRFWPQSHGVYIWCSELIVPGETFCSEHLIAVVALRDHLDDLRAHGPDTEPPLEPAPPPIVVPTDADQTVAMLAHRVVAAEKERDKLRAQIAELLKDAE